MHSFLQAGPWPTPFWPTYRLALKRLRGRVSPSGSEPFSSATTDLQRRTSRILQLPLPDGFDAAEALALIDPAKDADGLHPENLGKLVLMEDGPLPCTPAGIVEMLKYYEVDVKGKHVVVVGRGTTLGRPMALLMTTKNIGANAATTVVHTGVDDIAAYTKEADIVIAAVGRPGTITKDMVKPGAIVVSGGISWEGKKLLPDVNEDVGDVASWITPRLGGVGPLTVAMLLKNTVEAAERAHS